MTTSRSAFRRRIKKDLAAIRHLARYADHNRDIDTVYGTAASDQEHAMYVYKLEEDIKNLKQILMFSESPVLKIERWAEIFSLPVLEKPTLLPELDNDLAIKLVEEELEEVKHALRSKDIIEMVDGLGDLFWVVVRAMQSAGVDVDKTIDAIYDSNMSKLATSKEEAEASVKRYEEMGIKTGFKKVGKKYYKIFRLMDNKVLKSINFAVPNFDKLWD
jgi:NTP pyrophosphatase (non-canonical NTP hydrolase)